MSEKPVVIYRCPSGKHGFTREPCDSPDAGECGTWLPTSTHAEVVAALEEGAEYAEKWGDVIDGHDGAALPDRLMRLGQTLRRALALIEPRT